MIDFFIGIGKSCLQRKMEERQDSGILKLAISILNVDCPTFTWKRKREKTCLKDDNCCLKFQQVQFICIYGQLICIYGQLILVYGQLIELRAVNSVTLCDTGRISLYRQKLITCN
jgi:hypothetical protein